MMLNQAQRDVIAQLTDPSGPRVAAVQADVGSGGSRVIEALTEAFTRTTSVLVVVPTSAALAQQWILRLTEIDAIAQVQQLSLSLALDMLEGGVPAVGSVVVATPRLLHQPIVKRLLRAWSGVLIAIEPTAKTLEHLEGAISAAQRTIAIVVSPKHPIGDIPIVARLEFEQHRNSGLRPYYFDVPHNEGALTESAGLFTQRNRIKQWEDSPDTRPTLMDRLLRIATAKVDLAAAKITESEANDVKERSWGYIEQLEQLGVDPRLIALDSAIGDCGRTRIVVATPTLADLDYVMQHLQSTRGGARKVDSAEEAALSLEADFGVGSDDKLLVGTASLFSRLIAWPDSVALIVWSREEHVLDELPDLMRISGHEIYAAVLRPKPRSDANN